MTLREKTLIQHLFNALVDISRINNLVIFLSKIYGSNFVDQSFDFDWAVVLNLGCVFVNNKNLSKTNSTSI